MRIIRRPFYRGRALIAVGDTSVVAKDQLPTPPLAEQQYEDHHSADYYADRAYQVRAATKSQREIHRFENDDGRIGDH